MDKRKWSPKSLTILVWAAVMSSQIYLLYHHIDWYMRSVGIGKYSLILAAIANIMVRFVTYQPIGKGGKKLIHSKTFWLNLFICVSSAANLYWALHTGQYIVAPSLGFAAAVGTIYLRVKRTNSRITLFPGILGRLA